MAKIMLPSRAESCKMLEINVVPKKIQDILVVKHENKHLGHITFCELFILIYSLDELENVVEQF